MSMIVKFWGTRGVTPAPGSATQIYGGNTPCVEIRTEQALFICDAGSGLRLLSQDLQKRGEDLPIHLFLSHAHAANIQGLPFFDALFEQPSRVTLYCHPGAAPTLKKVLNGELALFTSKSASAKIADLSDAALDIAGVTIRNFAANHSPETRGFSFESGGRKAVYLAENELAIQSGDTFPDPKNQSILMRQMPRNLLQAAHAASLLIMDAQFSDEQYAQARGKGHSSCISVTDFALQAAAEQLALFHHDPNASDADLEERARQCSERAVKFGAKLTIFPAREGMALKL